MYDQQYHCQMILLEINESVILKKIFHSNCRVYADTLKREGCISFLHIVLLQIVLALIDPMPSSLRVPDICYY